MSKDAVRIVAVVLSIGLATALNLIVAAVLWDAVQGDVPGLSENATQILTGWGGGIIGVLGGFVGHELAQRKRPPDDEPPTP